MRQIAISTVILAGGLGTRIGGDKGLQILQGRALLDWVLDAVGPQSGEVLISANANLADYAVRGCPVIADDLLGQAGPLAGLQAAMRRAQYARVASVPCDTPFLPPDLLARLSAALDVPEVEAAVAVCEGRRQFAIAMYRKDVLPRLDTFLATGRRKLGEWLQTLRMSEVVFDDVRAFTNINTQDELRQLSQL